MVVEGISLINNRKKINVVTSLRWEGFFNKTGPGK